MADITVLAHDEAVQLDQDQLGLLYGQLGEQQADTVICKALEELANRLSSIERAFYQDDRAALAKAARGLVGVADQIGLQDFATIATDVSKLALRKDDPALAAALARLVRLGDRSLAAIWEVQDMGGAV